MRAAEMSGITDARANQLLDAMEDLGVFGSLALREIDSLYVDTFD